MQKERSWMKIPNKKFFDLLKIQYLNKIHLILHFPHRVPLACPVVCFVKKQKQSQTAIFLTVAEQKWKLE